MPLALHGCGVEGNLFTAGLAHHYPSMAIAQSRVGEAAPRSPALLNERRWRFHRRQQESWSGQAAGSSRAHRTRQVQRPYGSTVQ